MVTCLRGTPLRGPGSPFPSPVVAFFSGSRFWEKMESEAVDVGRVGTAEGWGQRAELMNGGGA